MTYRTTATQAKYDVELTGGKLKSKECPLCGREPGQTFKYWKIIANKYPYDRIAKKHDMLVSLRHVPDTELTKEEHDEFEEIKRTYLSKNYDYLMEAMDHVKSIPAHFHVHLIVTDYS